MHTVTAVTMKAIPAENLQPVYNCTECPKITTDHDFTANNTEVSTKVTEEVRVMQSRGTERPLDRNATQASGTNNCPHRCTHKHKAQRKQSK